jgi:mycothiol conjugate amidase Mca
MQDQPLTLMAVHAHPDDETIAGGGVLARYAAEGFKTVLVTATRGEEGEIHDSTLDTEQVRHRLAEIRTQELTRAADILGISELYFLGYRDSGMAGTPENDNPHNFHNASPDEAASRLVRLIRQTRPHVLITYDEHGGYGHPDHVAAHRITLAAFDAAGDPRKYPAQGLPPWQPQKLYYAVFPRSQVRRIAELLRERGLPVPFEDSDTDFETIGVPDERISTRVDVRDYLMQKRAAMRAHQTQIPADNIFLSMPDEMAREVLGVETFVLARTLVPVSGVEVDLFTGLREPAELVVAS